MCIRDSEYPRFRMNDDREVSCWWLLTEHLAGRDVQVAARQAWFAQRELDDGCNMLGTAMVDAHRFAADDVWRKARLSVEANRPAAARAAVGLLGNALARDVAEALDNPQRFLRRTVAGTTSARQELKLLAILRMAASDVESATGELDGLARNGLSPALAAWAWASMGRQAALKLAPEAASHYQRAWSLLSPTQARW